MYTDGTILIADSEYNLKKAIHPKKSYCDQWQLTVNEANTRIIIFGKAKSKPQKYKLLYNNTELEIVDSYKY